MRKEGTRDDKSGMGRRAITFFGKKGKEIDPKIRLFRYIMYETKSTNDGKLGMDYWESGMSWAFSVIVFGGTMYLCWVSSG